TCIALLQLSSPRLASRIRRAGCSGRGRNDGPRDDREEQGRAATPKGRVEARLRPWVHGTHWRAAAGAGRLILSALEFRRSTWTRKQVMRRQYCIHLFVWWTLHYVQLRLRWQPRPWLLAVTLLALAPAAAVWTVALANSLGLT